MGTRPRRGASGKGKGKREARLTPAQGRKLAKGRRSLKALIADLQQIEDIARIWREDLQKVVQAIPVDELVRPPVVGSSCPPPSGGD